MRKKQSVSGHSTCLMINHQIQMGICFLQEMVKWGPNFFFQSVLFTEGGQGGGEEKDQVQEESAKEN